jgi:glycosyltransferase involved in cell wall biosynthesis
MKISIAATNPCHLFPLAVELARAEALGTYYSGYPEWKLQAPAGMPVRAHALRTTLVYGALKVLPAAVRPSSRALFLWQDHGFDAWVGRALAQCDFLHAIPGQALRGFQRAGQLGIRTVLNHATGPVREWVRIMEPEYQRVGLRLTDVCPYDAAYFQREEQEYALADFHCVASSVVRDQLTGLGIPADRIWLAGYGADPGIFHARGRVTPDRFRILFAGQVGLRKGIRTLLEALVKAARPDWELRFYGSTAPEVRHDLAAYNLPIHDHGPVSQPELAAAFRQGSVLVLPSLEEGFGLVIPQALNCGMPCIVSDRVGGKDLIRHRENGSVFPCGDAAALAGELAWWAAHWRPVTETHGWEQPARALIEQSQAALKIGEK